MSDTQETAVAVDTSADNAINMLAPHDPNAPQTPETEPKAAEPVVEEPKVIDDIKARQFAALSRKERQIRQQEKALKTQLAQMEQERQEWTKWKAEREAFEAEREAFEKEISENPLEALKKRGKSYEQLTEEFVLRGEETSEQKTNKYLKSLEDKLAAFETQLKQKEADEVKKQEDLKVEQAQQAKSNYLKGLTDFINQNSETYELVARNDAVELVFNVIESHYQQTAEESEDGQGVILSREDAAQAVEDYLLTEAKKLIESNKIKKLSAAASAEPKPVTPKSATLTNTPSTVVPTTGGKTLSDEESKRQIAAMLKWHT